MKLWILSDLHADRGVEDIAVRAPDFDVFVCAGDVLTGDVAGSIEMTAAIARGKPAVFVAGNHEWAGGPPEVVAYKGREAAERHGVHWLEGESVEIGGLRFAGATLWTPFDARYSAAAMMLTLSSARPDVIVTHFEPPADLLMRAGAKLWVYGHEHGFFDRTIGSRRVVRNARGYWHQALDERAREDFVVEIEP